MLQRLTSEQVVALKDLLQKFIDDPLHIDLSDPDRQDQKTYFNNLLSINELLNNSSELYINI